MADRENQMIDMLGDDGGANPLLRWREYLHVLRERIWIAVTVFVIVVVSALIWNVRQTPMYKAHSTLQVDMFVNRILDIPDISASGTPGYMFGQYINTLVRGLKSHFFIEKVVDSIKQNPDPVAKRFLNSPGNKVSAIMSGLTVAVVKDSQMIKIEVRNPDAEVAALLANAIAEEFINQDRNRRMAASLAAVKWLKEQADDQKKKVDASEMAIQKYREDCNMVSLEQQQDTIVSKLKDVNKMLTDAESRETTAHTKWNSIESALKNGEALDEIPAIAEDQYVIQSKEKINEIKQKITTLKRKYKAKHPLMIAATNDLQNARVAYTKACFSAKARAKSEYTVAKANAQALDKALKKQEKQALALSRMMVEYNVLKRNAEADQQLYQSIIVRMKEAHVSGRLDTTNIRISDKAYVPSRPYSPNIKKNMVAACGAGIMLGLVLIVIVHMMDDRVRRVEDFEVTLGVPVLGLIPNIDMESESERALIVLNDGDSHAAEAFRMLNAGMMLDEMGRDAKVIMVVSSGSSEGKSLVSSNLASVLAQNGAKTLLVDADLRRPVQHKLHNISRSQKGLPSLVLGELSWDDVVVRSEQDGLDILTGTCVPASSSPSRLIASQEMKRLIGEARGCYDRIVIDCPPIFGVSDPLLLFPVVDAIIFVSRYNRTHQRAIKEATQKIIDNGAPLIGAVINGVQLSSHSYYYHRYGYNKYYGKTAGKGDDAKHVAKPS